MANAQTAVPPGPPEAGPAEPPPAPATNWRSWVEWGVILTGALVIAFVVRVFLFASYYIPSGSMETTLNINDRVLVNKLSYKMHSVHRGDVIVFKRPPNEQAGPIKDLIKRVVAVQNDVVELEGGHVIVNGKQVDEPYTHGQPTTPLNLFSVCPPADNRPNTCKVPAHDILVMGDNRTNSLDGRVFGPINTNLVIGRAFIRIWPVGQIALL